MNSEYSFGFLFLTPLNADNPNIFGFTEFIAGLALMVLAWTIADVRYRFRLQTAPFPLLGASFGIVTVVGILTLMTDLWHAEQWLVLKGDILTPALWQASLGGLFILTFLTWAWVAFIRPPIFSRWNSKRYARALYRYILKGSPIELAVVADELSRSAKQLIHYAYDRNKSENNENDKKNIEFATVGDFANDLLLLIADKRLCKAFINSSPVTILIIFREISETKKYNIPINIFAKNIMTEAIWNKDSFLYHECDGFSSGLIGYHKPLSNAMFSSFIMADKIRSLFDIKLKSKMDSEQIRAYLQALLITLQDYINNHFGHICTPIHTAYSIITPSIYEVSKLNGKEGETFYNDDILDYIRAIIDFIHNVLDVLEQKELREHIKLRIRKKSPSYQKCLYDNLAEMAFDIIVAASSMRSPKWESWVIQHNLVWSKLFDFLHENISAYKIFHFKLRRLLYNEIKQMDKSPNYKGAMVLGFCLNVMGLSLHSGEFCKHYKPLHKAVLFWTKKHFARLYEFNPRVLKSGLVDGITYDANNYKLMKTYELGLEREPSVDCFDVDPPL